MYVRLSIYIYMYIYHISVMELGHLLTRSGLTYPEVSSKVYHNSFCPLGSSVSLLLVIYFEAFYLRIIYIYIYIYMCVCVCSAGDSTVSKFRASTILLCPTVGI